jgi:two-component system LytT family response regulator
MSNIKCIIVDDEPTARDIMQLHLEQIEGIEIVAHCRKSSEALDFLYKKKVDLIFLDINMPDMSGISLAKSVSNSTKIIFTTAYREYAVDGFDLQAVDYLLKPISLGRLAKAIEKYRTENTSNNTQRNYLVVRSERKMVKLNITDIILIESLSDYVKILTTTKTIVTRETISNIESKLSKKNFIRIHRSFIVAIPFISSYTSEYVEIKKETINISRTYRDSFFKIMERR